MQSDKSAENREIVRKRLALILPNLSGGGCERAVAYLLPHFVDAYDVDLVLHENRVDYPVPEAVNVRSLEGDTSPRHGPVYKVLRFLRKIFRLRRHLRDENYDIIISCIDMNNVISWFALKLSGRSPRFAALEQTVCASFFEHNPYVRPKAGIMKALLRFCYNRTTLVIALSRSMEAYLREIGVASPIVPIYNCIDEDVFYPEENSGSAERDAEKKLAPEFLSAGIKLVNIGRLEHNQKNQPFLISIFPRILERFPEARLFFIGDGPDREMLKNQVEEAGLSEKIFFLGWQKNPADYLRRADLMLHAARYETFGNVLVESLACGTPVVVHDCDPVIGELLSESEYAKIISPEEDKKENYFSAVFSFLEKFPEINRREVAEYPRANFTRARMTEEYLNAVKRLES